MMFAIITAYILDLIVGDPQWYWHPVRIIGRIIDKLERKLNTDKFSVNKMFSGSVLVVLVIGLTVFSVWFTLKLAKLIHPFLYHALFVLLIYFALSVRSLGTEAKKVYIALKNNNVQNARNSLSMLVGRDTDKLNEPEIIRASVETVAESIMDGIIAPLFYAFIGGPVLAWAYKAINTLDSMVGYRSERFIKFGKPAAKLDGIVNFIPARITALLISASCFFCANGSFNSIKWGLKYFFRGQEFNSL
ncbi:MAG: adenosylcobinamide-phosphate synthase CbiB, partial [Candidatus Omnitrophota bacterium]|nr:adenosylcobinamide-phosphate synthase CbiB [Candidatus Omnitrophota bacterium]